MPVRSLTIAQADAVNNLDLSGEISDPDEKKNDRRRAVKDLVFLPAARRTVIWSHLPFSLFPAEISCR